MRSMSKKESVEPMGTKPATGYQRFLALLQEEVSQPAPDPILDWDDLHEQPEHYRDPFRLTKERPVSLWSARASRFSTAPIYDWVDVKAIYDAMRETGKKTG